MSGIICFPHLPWHGLAENKRVLQEPPVKQEAGRAIAKA